MDKWLPDIFFIKLFIFSTLNSFKVIPPLNVSLLWLRRVKMITVDRWGLRLFLILKKGHDNKLVLTSGSGFFMVLQHQHKLSFLIVSSYFLGRFQQNAGCATFFRMVFELCAYWQSKTYLSSPIVICVLIQNAFEQFGAKKMNSIYLQFIHISADTHHHHDQFLNLNKPIKLTRQKGKNVSLLLFK